MAVQHRDRIGEAIVSAAARFGVEELKPEQETAIRVLVDGSDVFVCLPTGYGKSLCFGLLPFVYDHLRGVDNSNQSSIVVRVVPSQSIMTDQYEIFTCRGLSVELVVVILKIWITFAMAKFNWCYINQPRGSSDVSRKIHQVTLGDYLICRF